MNIQLPSKKYINIDEIDRCGLIKFYDIPDVYIRFWYEFEVFYKNNKSIILSYDTQKQAELDREFILQEIQKNN